MRQDDAEAARSDVALQCLVTCDTLTEPKFGDDEGDMPRCAASAMRRSSFRETHVPGSALGR